ncbi:hypothetical protein [Actinomadura macrotermitis]|uniref:DUF1269 domain-containing protein n=1 Tax=Actinomadura macrotermitis TaxID=2585200 RepID=A0A7K0BML3_9ACTN|nr:hypothetical protein [Actinomadura macrotermitis]MQY02112.1 hypothetical protein [Actinomadura macrotermitis]
MPTGPVQLIVLGFARAGFQAGINAELGRLRRACREAVDVLDALAVFKEPGGGLEVEHLGALTRDEAIEAGSRIADLVGLAIEGERSAAAARSAGEADIGDAEILAEDAWDVLDEIPPGSAAALVLLEHRWAIPLRDAIARTGGHHISDGFVSPLDLTAIGLHTAEEAERLYRWETGDARRTR